MDPEQLITNALTKIENGNYAGAVLDLEAAIRLDPANPMAQNSLALARLAMGDSAGAVSAYRRAIELDPDDLDARMGCARALAASGEHNEAVSVLRQVLIADAGNPEALALRAECYEAVDQFPLAARDLSDLLSHQPDDGGLRLRLARALARGELLKEAVVEFDTYLALAPGDLGAIYDRGVAHMRTDQLRHAVNDFSICIDVDDNHLRARQNRGNCLLRLGMTEDSLLDYDRLIKHRDSAVARLNRGIIHRRLGNHNRARVDFAQAVALDSVGQIADRARRYLQPGK